MLLRLLLTYIRTQWRPGCELLSTFSLRFAVLPTDLDIFRHMNNGVYFSIMDLGRVDMLIRSGLLEASRKAGYSFTVAAETIRFRRSLTLFQRFSLETRVIGWDDKAFLIEHRFVRRSHAEAPWEIMAEGIVRVRLVSNGNGAPSTNFISKLAAGDGSSPQLPNWIEEWNLRQAHMRDVDRSRSPAA